MSDFERKYSPGNRYMICIGKTESTSEKGLLVLIRQDRVLLIDLVGRHRKERQTDIDN